MEFSKQELEIAGALRRLLRMRFLLRSKNEKWFQTIIDLRQELMLRCRSIALTLEINEALGVAYLRPIDDDSEEALAYQVGRKRSLSPLGSALIFKLRHQRLQFYLSPNSDTVPLITVEDMREFLQNFNSIRVDTFFERSFRKSVEELEELQVLQETKPGSGLFEITPLCEILLPLDKIKEMEARMQTYFSSRGTDGVVDVG